MPTQVPTSVARHRRASYQHRPFYVVLDGWRLSLVGGSLVILTATSIAAVVTR